MKASPRLREKIFRLVAQIFNLRAFGNYGDRDVGGVQPNTIRRYGRLKICAPKNLSRLPRRSRGQPRFPLEERADLPHNLPRTQEDALEIHFQRLRIAG